MAINVGESNKRVGFVSLAFVWAEPSYFNTGIMRMVKCNPPSDLHYAFLEACPRASEQPRPDLHPGSYPMQTLQDKPPIHQCFRIRILSLSIATISHMSAYKTSIFPSPRFFSVLGIQHERKGSCPKQLSLSSLKDLGLILCCLMIYFKCSEIDNSDRIAVVKATVDFI